MRTLNSMVTRMLAAGTVLEVWSHAMLHVVRLRPCDDTSAHDLRLAA